MQDVFSSHTSETSHDVARGVTLGMPDMQPRTGWIRKHIEHIKLRPRIPVDRAEGVVLLAGGVGVTPMLSMTAALIEKNSRQPIWFFYGIRNSYDLIQVEFLRQAAERNNNFNLVICFSNPAEYEELGEDYHHKGRVSVDLLKKS